MSSKSLSPENPFAGSFLQGMRRAPKGSVKSLLIAMLLVVSVLILITTMLVHYPKRVDAFLNLDNPVLSKQVVTSNK
jgi:hypothetical protein